MTDAASAEGAFLRAVAAHRAGDLATAEALYLEALEAEPWRAAHNLGVIQSSSGQLSKAEASFRRALAVRPDLPETRYSLAHALLAQGRYLEGWPEYEARRRLPRLEIPSGPPETPEWTGEPLDGRRLLVLGEQGFGDQIMFARFHRELEARGADVVFVCRSGLNRLIEGSRPSATDLASLGADLWTLGCTLPLRLGMDVGDIPPPLELGVPISSGGGIGVVARGRSTHPNDAHRSLTPQAAERLLRLGRDLSPEATGARDWLDTARIVAGLDLVVAVDTAIAHLAASLGKPTWILISALGVDWRWMRRRADSPWYPTVRLIRQPAPGDWASVLDEVEQALR